VDHEAVGLGALVAGGADAPAIYLPAIVADVHPDMRISRDELFGPAVRDAVRYDRRSLRWRTTASMGLPPAIHETSMGDEFAREAEAGNCTSIGALNGARSHAYGGFERLRFWQRRPEERRAGMTELKMVCFI